MTVMNKLDRFDLVQDVVTRTPKLKVTGAFLKEEMKNKLVLHKNYIYKHGIDMPEVRDWEWDL